MQRLWWGLPIAFILLTLSWFMLNQRIGQPPSPIEATPAPPPKSLAQPVQPVERPPLPVAPPTLGPVVPPPVISPPATSSTPPEPTATPHRPVKPLSSPLDEALQKLVKGNIAFNNPQQMRIGETGEVEAIIAVTVPADELMNALTVEGKRENASLLVSDRMQAALTGGGAFDVAPTGPQTQWLSKDAPTVWHWLVTPKLTGPQFLTLSVDAIITINGEKDTRNITTLTRQIAVEVARPHNEEEWFAWVKEHIEAVGWGWGVLAAVIGTMTGFWRRLRQWFRKASKKAGTRDTDEDHD